VAAPALGAAQARVRVHTLAGEKTFPESIGVDPRTGAFFTGSLIDGSVDRGNLASPGASVFLPAGSDGRSAAAGVKLDPQGRVWICDAFHRRVLVYDQRGRLLHSFVVEGPGKPTVNDIAFTHGEAYITDSARPFLYRVKVAAADTPGITIVKPWLDVSPPVVYHTGQAPFGVNLNGIVASPDGKTLLVVQTNTGLPFRVDVASRRLDTVTVTGSSLVFGDGLLRVADSLYVARNAANEIVKLKLGPHWRSAKVVNTITNRQLPADTQLAFPTGLAELHGRLLVTNCQANDTSNPKLPFTVLDLPLR
jgi:Cu-Zn family superoxide dismutase